MKSFNTDMLITLTEGTALGARSMTPMNICRHLDWQFFSASVSGVSQYRYFLERISSMLWSIIGILVVIWVIALVAKATVGGLIHLLLVVAVVLLVYRLLTGRNIT